MQRTLVFAKPDAVRRGLVGEIVSRLERKGLKIVALKMLQMDRAMAERHYDIHRDKPFFSSLVDFITSGPIVAAVVEGREAVDTVRGLMGATDPLKSSPGTIRGDFGTEVQENLVHGSDSEESARQEIAHFFPELADQGPGGPP
ncbi:MAG: nucleoside-diphosphate kinase [Chloroflexi bacterium]|nr:MAG: nucleoside-diphosphate kinase [Chloroflexota bacterium]RLC95201.1 MAG: nucleoside-diphosphate kinase [Chloroflexota bacterium]